MITAYARLRYEENQVQTTGGKLVVMAYDCALRFLAQALDAMERGDLERQGYYLGRAQNVLYHLMATLNYEAGQIAYDLRDMYSASIRCLLIANARDDRALVERVQSQLSDVRDGWEKADRVASRAAASLEPAVAAAA